jgi:hypothetical protein
MRHMGETVKEMLVRQGIEAGRAGNTGRHGMIAQPAGTGAAGKGTGNAKSPAKFFREEKVNVKPSPSREEARPVPLTLIDGGSRYKGVSTAPLYLVQP